MRHSNGKVTNPPGARRPEYGRQTKAVVQKYTARGVATACVRVQVCVRTQSQLSRQCHLPALQQQPSLKVDQLQSAHKLDITVQRQNYLRSWPTHLHMQSHLTARQTYTIVHTTPRNICLHLNPTTPLCNRFTDSMYPMH